MRGSTVIKSVIPKDLLHYGTVCRTDSLMLSIFGYPGTTAFCLAQQPSVHMF